MVRVGCTVLLRFLSASYTSASAKVLMPALLYSFNSCMHSTNHLSKPLIIHSFTRTSLHSYICAGMRSFIACKHNDYSIAYCSLLDFMRRTIVQSLFMLAVMHLNYILNMRRRNTNVGSSCSIPSGVSWAPPSRGILCSPHVIHRQIRQVPHPRSTWNYVVRSTPVSEPAASSQ